MTKDTTKAAAVAADILLFDDWSDAIEDGVRARVRGFIETMLEEELDEALSRPRHGRRKARVNDAPALVVGCRHGHRKRALTGTVARQSGWKRGGEQAGQFGGRGEEMIVAPRQ